LVIEVHSEVDASAIEFTRNGDAKAREEHRSAKEPGRKYVSGCSTFTASTETLAYTLPSVCFSVSWIVSVKCAIQSSCIIYRLATLELTSYALNFLFKEPRTLSLPPLFSLEDWCSPVPDMFAKTIFYGS
jgi:hypothetical protein